MKTIKRILLPVCLIILAPVMAAAHPGHDHGENIWQTFIHFMFTYYIFFIIALVLIGGVIRYLYVLRSGQKHDMVKSDHKKE
jgi:H+/gluconate symporter-like permease